eukprot:768174-Hanusia_phi.AAC.1
MASEEKLGLDVEEKDEALIAMLESENRRLKLVLERRERDMYLAAILRFPCLMWVADKTWRRPFS